MINIGKNNVVSAAVKSFSSAQYTHAELDDINFELSDDIIISAMDPNYKTDTARLDFERKLVDIIPSEKRVIYISTLRLIEDDFQKLIYCKNKYKIEKLFYESFPNLVILRLPIIISINYLGKSNFQEIFQSNLKNNIIKFDVPKYSKYNFLTETDMTINFKKLIQLDSRVIKNIYNKDWYTASQISRYFSQRDKTLTTKYGNGTPSYSMVLDHGKMQNGFIISKSNFELGLLNA